MFNNRKLTITSLAVMLALSAACGKKKTPLQPPPPPPAATNTGDSGAGAGGTGTTRPVSGSPAIAQFSAEPTTIQRGQSATLRWEVSGGVTSVSIDQAIGTVQNTGNRRVFPSDNTTYTLTATGPGGATTAQATVTVVSPPPPPPPVDSTRNPGAAAGTFDVRLGSDLQDVYFEYDKSDTGGQSQSTLAQDAAALKTILADFPTAVVVIEGHCDERGSAEYNLGLGDRRASSVKDYLVQLGVPADRLKTISYGKERPQCSEQDEACWQKNRRAHFSPGQ